MINLIFENGRFSFEGIIPSKLDSPTVDVTIKVFDNVPQKCKSKLEVEVCDFLNEKYHKRYKVYPGTYLRTEETFIKEFNLRLSD